MNEIDRGGGDAVIAGGQTRGLRFNETFAVLLFSLVIYQAYQVYLALSSGIRLIEKGPVFAPQFYHQVLVSGIVWYMVMMGVIMANLRIRKVSLKALVNLDAAILRSRLGQVALYFLGCATVVTAVSLLETPSEMAYVKQSPAVTGLFVVSTVVMAPVVEEIIFRAYLQTAMLSRFRYKKERIVVNAMLFAAAHVFLVSLLLGAPVPYYVFVVGILLAKLYEETRSVLPGMVLHALNNGLVVALLFLRR